MIIEADLKISKGLILKRIPSATFSLGRLEEDGEYALFNDPIETTIDRDFYISDTPVTNTQFQHYLEEKGEGVPDYLIEHWDNGWITKYKFEKYFNENPQAPVVGVSYHDAQEYLEWLNSKNADLKIRLPTEAEFEWASKAGCDCRDFCKNAVKVKHDLRSYGDPPKSKVPSVKAQEPNVFGLYDMHGSVWQWCSDWYSAWDYSKEKNLNPKGPEVKPEHVIWKGVKSRPGYVIRGGSFNYGVLHARCSSRHYSHENDRNFNLGFRVAASLVI